MMERDLTVTLNIRIATNRREGPSDAEVLGALSKLLTGSSARVQTTKLYLRGEEWVAIGISAQVKSL